MNFTRETTSKILDMPLSFHRAMDQMIWRYKPHGFFTVKSAYPLSKFSHIHNKRPSSSTIPKEWKQLWKIDVIPRVRLFLWKACNNALPTRTNLKKRGSGVDPRCMICGEGNETTEHLLLRCEVVFSVWYGSMLRMDTRREMATSFRELVWEKIDKTPAEYVELFAYTTWAIWNARNATYFEKKPFECMRINARAYSQWREYSDKQTARTVKTTENNGVEKTDARKNQT